MLVSSSTNRNGLLILMVGLCSAR